MFENHTRVSLEVMGLITAVGEIFGVHIHRLSKYSKPWDDINHKRIS